jgi:Ca2+-binding RTX toxin-like protein
MFLINRRALAAIGVTAAAIGSTALLSAPAQAAAAGTAKVVGSGVVQFTALTGKANGLTITISGQTVTLDDLVAINAGAGCAAVAGDKTKVTCTTPAATSGLSVQLGDKNDWVKNKTSVSLTVNAGSGNDKIYGGGASDRLTGGTGNDYIVAGNGNDAIYGQAGNDVIYGQNGNDSVSAGAGNDKVYGQAGDDKLYGGTGADLLNGWTGIDKIYGQAGNDVIYAGAGEVGGQGDIVYGGPGNDKINGEGGADEIFAGSGNDTITGGAGDDLLMGESGTDSISGGAGYDFLIGESVTNALLPAGSTKAKDKLYGGANIDLCISPKGAKYSGCEYKKWSDYIDSLTSARSSAIEGRLSKIA